LGSSVQIFKKSEEKEIYQEFSAKSVIIFFIQILKITLHVGIHVFVHIPQAQVITCLLKKEHPSHERCMRFRFLKVRVNMLSPSDLTHDVSGGVRFSRNFM
jgi:hypothetical protein